MELKTGLIFKNKYDDYLKITDIEYDDDDGNTYICYHWNNDLKLIRKNIFEGSEDSMDWESFEERINNGDFKLIEDKINWKARLTPGGGKK